MSAQAVIHNPTGRLAAEHPGWVKLGRIGWLAKGVVYLLAGFLAIVLAAQSRGWATATAEGEEASPTGAIKEVAHSTGGPVLLWALAVGLFLYAAWRLVSAAMPGDGSATAWVVRAGYVVSAVLYASFGATAVSLARAPSTATDGNEQATDLTTRVMDHSAGRWLIGAVGLLVLAAAAYRMVKAARMDVDDELDLTGMSAARRAWYKRLGAFGEVARGLALATIGFFLVRAAQTYDASEATGLDGALRRLLAHDWGVAVVLLIGAGFVAYGAFCVVTFHRRRLEAP